MLLKKSGINPGVIFKIDKNKTFHDDLKNRSSYDSLDLKQYFSSISIIHEKETNKLRINLSEPLVYFILEHLGYGPEVEIIINPYANEGLYIVSKNIGENGKKFYLFKDINDKIKTNKIKESDLINNENLAISLNEQEIVSRILSILSRNAYGIDLSDKNIIGKILIAHDNTNKTKLWLMLSKKLKIN